MKIGFTGANGRLGQLVGIDLLRRRLPHRAMSRDPSTIPPSEDREAVALNFDDDRGLRRAFSGLARLFLISTPDCVDVRIRRHRRAIEAARAEGVQQIIFLSICDASSESPFPFAVANHDTETALRQDAPTQQPDWTVLRANLYAESLVTMGMQDIEAGRLRFPWPNAAVGYVARQDIARVAAGLLESGDALGKTLDVTGPAALTLTEAASVLSDVRKSPVALDPLTIEEYEQVLSRGFPPDTVAAFSGLCRALDGGRFDRVTDVVKKFGGYPATSLFDALTAEYARLNSQTHRQRR
ncbi:MAG: NAD(P)H-binding protein [Myxococcota bacterium]